MLEVPTSEEIERTRERYEGKRIKLIEMPEDPDPVEPGTVGTCEMVDGMGQLMMKWDDGRTLNLIPGVDRFITLEEYDADVIPEEDEDHVWVEDRRWIKLDQPRQCRRLEGPGHICCKNTAHWGLRRSNARNPQGTIWAYCENHMYGRRVRNGIVEVQVRKGSPAAERGWAD